MVVDEDVVRPRMAVTVLNMYRLSSCHYTLNNTVQQLFTQHLRYVRYYKYSIDDVKNMGGCV